MTPITPHFCLDEFIKSDTAKAKGIQNLPDTRAVVNISALCINVLEPLRVAMGHPIKIGSGFRCKELNKAVGGVYNSQHITGHAADLCIDGDLAKGKKWFNYIKNHLPFDQLIWEHNSKGNYWVHVSFRTDGKNRKQVIDNLLKK